MEPKWEPIRGGYLHLDIGGREHRLYVEQAGSGIPLLCLHTAGADGRQYRALLNDGAVTGRFRVIVFDMPWHGKSSPPDGWWNEEYSLDTAGYAHLILTVADALGLDRPVAMGCSIGGRIVLELAAHHPDRFRALIGLQTGAFVNRYYDLDWLHRPDVHGGRIAAGIVSGLIGPGAPEADRQETLWHYMCGGPGVFKGDLHFYSVEGDMRGLLRKIDVSRCPLHLLTGEYDYSATPADTRAVAEATGADFVEMKGLGHFPMSEDPERFREYLLPILDRIT